MSPNGTRELQHYISSLTESRSSYVQKAGDGVSVDASKGIRLTLSPSWSKNPRALQLVADIEAQRRKCPALNDKASDSRIASSGFCLNAGSEVSVCTAGRRSFDRQYSLPVGEFMFFQFADVLICQSRADYYTLDEWAKYLGKLLKPLIVSFDEDSTTEKFQIPMDEMPDVKKWMYLSFALLKELAKDPSCVDTYNRQWSSNAFLDRGDVANSWEAPGCTEIDADIPRFRHPPDYKPAAVQQMPLR